MASLFSNAIPLALVSWRSSREPETTLPFARRTRSVVSARDLPGGTCALAGAAWRLANHSPPRAEGATPAELARGHDVGKGTIDLRGLTADERSKPRRE